MLGAQGVQSDGESRASCGLPDKRVLSSLLMRQIVFKEGQYWMRSVVVLVKEQAVALLAKRGPDAVGD